MFPEQIQLQKEKNIQANVDLWRAFIFKMYFLDKVKPEGCRPKEDGSQSFI